MKPAFESWIFRGTHFLGLPTADQKSIHVLDEKGNNYGSWESVARFRNLQRSNNPLAESIGKARLSIRPIQKGQ